MPYMPVCNGLSSVTYILFQPSIWQMIDLYQTQLYLIIVNTCALYCSALYCSVLYCSALYYCALYCCTLYSSALYCSALYCGALYCSALCPVLQCTVHVHVQCSFVEGSMYNMQCTVRQRWASLHTALICGLSYLYS